MKKTVLFVCSYTPSLLTFRGDLIKKLIEEDWNVICLGPTDSENIKESIVSLGADFISVPLERNGSSVLSDLKFLFNLIAKVKSFKPDMIVSYTIKPVIYASIAAWLYKTPLRVSLVTGLGISFSPGMHKSSYFKNIKNKVVSYIARNLFKLGLHLSTHILFQNNDDLNLVLSQSKITKAKMNVTNGSGVNLSCYPFRSRVITTDEALKFVMISRIITPKGIIQFLECAKSIKSVNSNVEFHLVGWFDLGSDLDLDSLKAYTENLDIIFHGKLDDVYRILNDCDVFVLPSYYPEGTPRTILEAMSSGMPIITTDSVGCRETVIDNYNGFLIEPKSTSSLIEACYKFLDDRSLVTSMGLNSYSLATDKYCVHKVNDSIFKIIGL